MADWETHNSPNLSFSAKLLQDPNGKIEHGAIRMFDVTCDLAFDSRSRRYYGRDMSQDRAGQAVPAVRESRVSRVFWVSVFIFPVFFGIHLKPNLLSSTVHHFPRSLSNHFASGIPR